MKNASILIIDDDRDVLDALAVLVEDDFARVVKERSPNRIETLLSEHFDIVLLDMNFSAGINTGNEGLFWLSKIKHWHPTADVIMMTAYGNINLAVEAIKRGAKDFVLKPWDNQKLLATLKSAVAEKAHRKPEKPQAKDDAFIPGRSPVMMKLQEQLQRVAVTDASVLLLGENGTGKEMFALQIHQLSKRANQAFTTVDLSAIPATLFESELFGHKKGAFTDARADREGKFQAADRGTLFLDEIGNLPLTQQVKLLTVLQQRSITPVGSAESIPIDVRIISATNANIVECVARGEFRQDLLYRINTITIIIPPLRERPEDIGILADAFLKSFKVKYEKPALEFSARAKNSMIEYSWPGNVRELKHTVEKAVILCDHDTIDADDLALSISGKPIPSNSEKTLEDIEKDAMVNALNSHGGNIVHAARALGITRQTLYNKMKKYGI
ncbi:MAG TPA: sigma-54 dependent transcriptional regulator [Chryseosolibacter sp.]